MSNQWTTEQIKELRTRREAGQGFGEIALALGHSEKSCQSNCTNHKIYLFGKQGPDKHAGLAAKLNSRPTGRALANKPNKRPCLCCKKDFISYGNGNRLCYSCANRSVADFYV